MILAILSELGRTGTEKKQVSLLPENLTKILRYINESFTEGHTVSDIAEKFFISPSTMNRYFRIYLRTTPREYIEAKRLAYALELLKQGRIDGMIFEANSTMGAGLPSEYWLREWVEQVKNTEVPD